MAGGMKRVRWLRAAWRRRRDESGQALVEFAMVTPLLALLGLGMVEFARAWHAYQVVSDAAREGARAAVLADPTVTQDSVAQVIRSTLEQAALQGQSAEVTIDGFDGAQGTPLRVDVRYPFTLTVLGGDGGGSITLHASAVMRNE